MFTRYVDEIGSESKGRAKDKQNDKVVGDYSFFSIIGNRGNSISTKNAGYRKLVDGQLR